MSGGRTRTLDARRALAAALLPALLVLGFACGGSGSGGGGGGGTNPGPPTASFAPGPTPAAADRVRIVGSASADLVTLEVVLGGPTTSSDLFGFAFDLVLSNPAMIAFVSASAGDALDPGTQSVEVQVASQGNRLVVGVSKLASATGGNGVGAGESTIVEIVLRATQAGTTTIAIDDPAGDSPAALDSNGQTVGSVDFDLAAATLQAG